jgi:hypothetical protein
MKEHKVYYLLVKYVIIIVNREVYMYIDNKFQKVFIYVNSIYFILEGIYLLLFNLFYQRVKNLGLTIYNVINLFSYIAVIFIFILLIIKIIMKKRISFFSLSISLTCSVIIIKDLLYVMFKLFDEQGEENIVVFFTLLIIISIILVLLQLSNLTEFDKK